MTIRTVFFDAGNTLLTPAVAEAQVVQEAAESLGSVVGLQVIEENIPRMYEFYEQYYGADNFAWAQEEQAAGIWLAMYEHLCELVGIANIKREVAKIGYERYLKAESWALFDDVLSTLFALKSRNVVLGLISNWDSSLEGIIEGLGIRFYFDTVIASAVVGMHKPEARIFQLAIDQVDAFLDETMYIGDHLQADVWGAANAGIIPILIDRENLHQDGEDYIRVTNLRDILKYL